MEQSAKPRHWVKPPNVIRGSLAVTSHYKTRVRAAFIALFQGSKLLLVQGKHSKLWQLPGGRVETTDAHVWEAATREYYEELGSLAALPAATIQGWFETAVPWQGGSYVGVIFVVQAADVDHTIPFAANDETVAMTLSEWNNLDKLKYRWPNNITIPQIYDHAQASSDGPRTVRGDGPYCTMKPTLCAGTTAKE
eukprot:m.271109 g.271109  ORF g.271109 m.271109 type:complete len:194 (+) comp93484_c0_seq1:236-817(+)